MVGLARKSEAFAYYASLVMVPKGIVSYLVGWLARLQMPKPLDRGMCRLFAWVFRLDMSEAAQPIEAFRTIEDVFTRALKPGARSIAETVASPADGILSWSKKVGENQAVQAKGLTYSLSDLVWGKPEAPYDFSWYSTVYLAPHNYHRVHSPVSGKLKEVRYFPGALWPVNAPFVRFIPRLFCRNERLVFDIELKDGGTVHVVMVGALNVGRIRTPHVPDFVSNSLNRQMGGQSRFGQVIQKQIEIGEELGTFMLGSTVVVVFDKDALGSKRLRSVESDTPIRMGASLLD